MIIRNKLIVVFISIIVLLTVEVESKKSEYLEFCLVDEQCDSDFLLVCTPPLCNCPAGSEIDVASQTCFVRANNTCELPTKDKPNPPRCTLDSKCLPTLLAKTCKCNEGFEPNNDGRCILKEYGRPCDPLGDKCDASQFLSCSNDNVCRCSANSVYLEGKCHRKKGASCTPGANNEPCIPNSSCNLASRTCICSGGTLENIGRYGPKCELPFGAPCNPLLPELCDASKFLQCLKIPTVCSCNMTLNDTYEDISSGTCYLLHGKECTTDEGSKQCHPNSKCTLVDKNTDLKQCLCNEGFAPNAKELCFLPYQASCDRNNDLCDTETHLSCSAKGVCECKDDTMWFDQNEGICKILVGHPCLQSGAGRPLCVANSLCLTGTCKCRNDAIYKFEVGADRQCYLPFEAGCTPGGPGIDNCSPYQRLNCNITTRKCDCEDQKNSAFNEDTGSCFSLVGAQCTESEHCFPNSYCKKSYGATEGICACNRGLSTNKERKCFLMNHGDNCNEDMDLCDPSSFLSCQMTQNKNSNTTSSRCSCSIYHNMYYDENLEQCRLKVGSKCNPSLDKENKDPKCGVRMICDDGDKKCRCESPYQTNENGVCILKKGQICKGKDAPCDSTKFLVCDNGFCGCGKNAVFDEQIGQCVLTLGSRCSFDYHSSHVQQCVQNTTCDASDHRCSCLNGYERVNTVTVANQSLSYCLKSFDTLCLSDDECNTENNLQCINNKCRCNGDYIDYDTEISTPHQYSSVNRWRIMCLPTYNISCSAELPCHPSLSLQCANYGKGNACSCFNPDDYVYNHEQKGCVGLIGTSCIEDSGCVYGAYCAHQNGTTRSICKCLLDDYIVGRTCDGIFSNLSYKNVFSVNLIVLSVLTWAIL